MPIDGRTDTRTDTRTLWDARNSGTTAWLGLGMRAACREPGSEGQRLRDPAPGRALEAGCRAGEGECVTGSEVTLETAVPSAQDAGVLPGCQALRLWGFPATPGPRD